MEYITTGVAILSGTAVFVINLKVGSKAEFLLKLILVKISMSRF
jgi:hypothetical protein